MATVAKCAFCECDLLHTILVASTDYECKCGLCPKCNGTFQECLERGKKFKETEEYVKLVELQKYNQKYEDFTQTEIPKTLALGKNNKVLPQMILLK